MQEVALPKSKTKVIIWTLLILMPVVGMAVDLIAPSLPAIAQGLNVSAQSAKNVIAIYLLGYAIGNFITGFLTDALGRQKLLRLSLIGFIVASLIPIIFPYIGLLLAARLLQGITIGASAVIARAIFADVLEPHELISLGTLIGTMWGLGPVLGPVIGGYLQHFFGWQAGFYFFAIVTTIIFFLVFFIVPETHFNRHALKIKTIKHNLSEVLTHQLFMSLVILMGLAYSLIIVFNTLGPFLIQDTLHYSPVFFGHLALSLGLVFLASTFTCRFLLKKYQAIRLLSILINSLLLLGLIFLILSLNIKTNISTITVISAIMFFSTGFIFPMSMGKGMSLFKHIAGTAGATMYLINVLITSFVAFLVSFVHIDNFSTLMIIYFALIIGFFMLYWFSIKKYI